MITEEIEEILERYCESGTLLIKADAPEEVKETYEEFMRNYDEALKKGDKI